MPYQAASLPFAGMVYELPLSIAAHTFHFNTH